MKNLQLTLIAVLLTCYSYAPTPITGILTACKWDTTVLSNATPGGTWTSSDAGIISMCPGISTTWVNMQPGGIWTSSGVLK